MNMAQMLGRLKPFLEGDVGDAYSKFKQATGKVGGEEFVEYLYKNHRIDRATYCELHEGDPVALATDKRTLVPWHEPSTEPAEAPAPPSRYEVLGLVGQGAMGHVHVARDLELNRKVAFKRLSRSPVSAAVARRFLSEVQITAQLDHPNIVPVYTLETDADGTLGYAMKLVHGDTLQDIIDDASDQVVDRGTPDEDHDLAARLEMFLKVCDAVAYAHSKGVLHRDIKPANIMVGRFHEVYVMDWGIARLVEGDPGDHDLAEIGDGIELTLDQATADQRTRVGSVVGTPAYMSPEQARGDLDALGPASDVYALGLMLYELALLKPAYTGPFGRDVLKRAEQGLKDPVEPYRIGERVPVDLVAVIHRATAPDPPDRYPSPEHLADDVRRFLRGEQTRAHPDDTLRRLRRWMGRHQRLTLALFALLLGGSVVAGTVQYLYGRAQVAEERLTSSLRQQRLGEVLDRVGVRAQRIDNHFLFYEGMLHGIAGAAVQALTHGAPVDGPLYHTADFRLPETSPPGMVFSPHYKRPISPDWPVFTVAPGVPETLWRTDLSRVNALRPLLRRTHLTGPETGAPPEDPLAQRAAITGEQVPMEWAYVAVQRSGVMYMFPGAAGWDDAYDPRTRPWYRDAVGQRSPVWGTPYVDLMGQGILMSCVVALYGGDDFLGVAGVDVQFDYVVDRYMTVPDDPAFLGAWLLDGDGRVMVQTASTSADFDKPATEELDPGLDFGPFDNPDVLAAARRGGSGTQREDGDVLVAWQRLQHLGWTYVIRLRERRDASAANVGPRRP